MIQIKNFLIKREQSQARLSFAKREKSRLLAKTILTLVALLAVTTGAWADETLLVTIENTGDNASFTSGSKTFDNIATVTFSNEVENDDDEDGWYNSGWSNITLSVTPATGYTITKVKFYCESGSAFDETSPFEATLYANQMYVNGSSCGQSGVTKIEVYGYVTPATVDVTGVTLSQTSASMTVGGDALTLTATVAPDDATDKTVTWTTSDASVATVTDGVVAAVAAGTATITVTATNGTADTSDDKTATCTVTVSPSGPKVAWDKTAKTGSFNMPGGNVTLEPEYYPQATVADGGVTAADADARATTDDPLVKVDATKLTGAKKLMYFVSNSGTTAPAYDAEGWTDQLPTAEGITQQGIVYVWYYPVGTDEGVDGATATYSDGDILSANAIPVTIAAEPTYAVTFAEGVNPAEPAEPEWTASPNTGVTKGKTVTVTYTGTKKVIGVKAEKKAAAPRPLAEAVAADLGKIAGADGNIYDTKAAAEAANTTAVAMIAYVGSATEHATYTHGLAIALADEGSTNWSTAKSSCEGKTAVTGAAWQLPSQSQWKTMFKANGGKEDDYTGLQTAAENAGGDGTLQNGLSFWTSTESGDNAYSVALSSGNSSVNFFSDSKTMPWQARAVLVF